MQRLSLFLLACLIAGLGCSQREARLFIYCSETFWYVMQEQTLFFNQIYRFNTFLIPIRADRAEDQTDDIVEVGRNRRMPTDWGRRPAQRETPVVSHIHINPNIVEQIGRISFSGIGDLFLTDSTLQLDYVRNAALSASESHVCYLKLTMLVPLGNPYQLFSVKDVLDANRRLGIIYPSFDGLGASSWELLGNIVPGGETEIPIERIFFFERQYDLLEALELGNVDAVLVWNYTSQISFLVTKYAAVYNAANERIMRQAERRKDREMLRQILLAMHQYLVEDHTFAEEIPLTENPSEHYIIPVRLVSLSTAFHHGHTKRFADFLRSSQSKEIFQRFGFVVE